MRIYEKTSENRVNLTIKSKEKSKSMTVLLDKDETMDTVIDKIKNTLNKK